MLTVLLPKRKVLAYKVDPATGEITVPATAGVSYRDEDGNVVKLSATDERAIERIADERLNDQI